MSWPMPDMPDPFLDEEWAMGFDEAVAIRDKDGNYHGDQGRNIRALAARSLAMRIRSEVGDLADTVRDLTLTSGQAADLLDHIRHARTTLTAAEAALTKDQP